MPNLEKPCTYIYIAQIWYIVPQVYSCWLRPGAWMSSWSWRPRPGWPLQVFVLFLFVYMYYMSFAIPPVFYNYICIVHVCQLQVIVLFLFVYMYYACIHVFCKSICVLQLYMHCACLSSTGNCAFSFCLHVLRNMHACMYSAIPPVFYIYLCIVYICLLQTDSSAALVGQWASSWPG